MDFLFVVKASVGRLSNKTEQKTKKLIKINKQSAHSLKRLRMRDYVIECVIVGSINTFMCL